MTINTELRPLLQQLKHDQNNPELHEQIGVVYMARALLSGSEYVDDNNLLCGYFCDWQSATLAIRHLQTSMQSRLSARTMIAMMSAYIALYDFENAEQAGLMALTFVQGDDRLSVCQLLTHAQACRGGTLAALDTLSRVSPKEFLEARRYVQNMAGDEQDFKTDWALRTAYQQHTVGLSGFNRNNYIEHCISAILRRSCEEKIEIGFACHMTYTFDYFYLLARQMHKDHLMRLALTFYASAMACAPENADVKRDHATVLALLGESQVAVQTFEQLIEGQPMNSGLYILGGLSAVSSYDDMRFQSIMRKQVERGCGTAISDYLLALYLEIAGNTQAVVNFYREELARNPKDSIKEYALDRVLAMAEFG